MSMDNRGGFHGYRKQPQQLSKSSSAHTDQLNHQIGVPSAEPDQVNHSSSSNGRLLTPVEMINHASQNNHTMANDGSANGGHVHSNGNNNSDHQDNNGNNNSNECTVREQDRFMPIANVIRIMRKILPPHAKISDDAKETIQECVSEYISFITGEANERCQREQRKTITAEDVLWAMSKLGFDDYIEPLTLYLHRYRELEGDRGSIRTCEPLLKISRAAMDHPYAAFAPLFHIGPPHPHGHPGYYGGAPTSSVNGYLKEAPSPTGCGSGSSDHAAGASHSQPQPCAAPTGSTVTSFEPYAQHNKIN